MPATSPYERKSAAGFTLLELLISLSVFMVISGAVLGGMASMQKNYRSMEIRTAMQQRMRAALELMSQEINQAGLPATSIDQNSLVNGPLAYSSTTVPANSTTPTLSVNSTAGMYPQQQLWLDVGTLQEPVRVTSVGTGTITVAPFMSADLLVNAHNGATAPGFPIFSMAVYGNGVMPNPASGMATYPPAAGVSTTYQLELFGDVNANGSSMVYVRYLCPAPGAPGPLKRTVWNVWDRSLLQDTNLLDGVTFCQFNYPNPVPPAALGTASAVPFTAPLITTVSINLTVQSQSPDPQTGAYLTVSKSFLNIQPRSINAAIRRAIDNGGDSSTLEINPTTGIFTNLP